MNPFPKFVAIAACDPRGLIGNKGKLPWYYPEDLEHFYRSTQGHVIIMGYHTFVSLPKRALADRTCIVFTKKHQVDPSMAHSVKSLAELRRYYAAHPELLEKTQFVVGGSSIFSLFFSEHLISEALITLIHKQYEGDSYFPLHYLSSWHKKTLHANQEFTIVRYTP